MRTITRFHRRAVMNRTSAIIDSPAPATSTPNSNGPPTVFQSTTTSVADECRMATYPSPRTVPAAVVAATAHEKITSDDRSRSAA